MIASAYGPNTAPHDSPDRWNHVLLYRAGAAAEVPLPDRYRFVDANGDDQYGPKLNDLGQTMINTYVMNQASIHDHCCLWQNGKVIDLGMLPGCTDMDGIAINRQGDIVGNAIGSFAHDKTHSHPFLWRRGSLYDLNTLVAHPGWKLTKVTGLNSRGMIIGQGQGDGKVYDYLLTPVTK